MCSIGTVQGIPRVYVTELFSGLRMSQWFACKIGITSASTKREINGEAVKLLSSLHKIGRVPSRMRDSGMRIHMYLPVTNASR
jgi:hypothetical protein